MARTDVRPSTAVSTMEAAPAVSNPEVRLTASHIRGLDGIRAVAVIGVLGISWRGGRVRRRAPRGRHLLRPLRLPHHLAAGRRMVEERDRVLPPLLRASGPAAPSRPLHPVAARRRLRPVVRRDRHVEHAAGRRPGHHALRRQLALHLLRAELFRTFRSALAAPAHLVAGGRGAVLRGLARGGPVRPAPGRTAGARRGGGGRHGRLGRPDPGALAPGRQRVAALLRHRHARAGSDGRSGAGHRGAGHRPQRGGPGGGR